MLALFDRYTRLFQTWKIIRYEQEGDSYLLQIEAILADGSRLILRDYCFRDGQRKYAYQWMNADGSLRRRWDNAPHWPEIDTAPHHVHIADHDRPQSSAITNLEDLFAFLADVLKKYNG